MPLVEHTTLKKRSLARVLNQLLQLFNGSKAELSLANGTFDVIKQGNGLAYQRLNRTRRSTESSAWMAELPAGKPHDAFFWSKESVVYLVHWPQVLAAAITRFGEERGVDAQNLAFELVHALVDVWELHDPSFAAEVRRRGTKGSDSVNVYMKSFHMTPDERSIIVFWDEHLTALLKNKKVLIDIRETMRNSLAVISNHTAESEMAQCPSGLHRAMKVCDVCRPMNWQRQVSLLNPAALQLKDMRSHAFLSVRASPQLLIAPTEPWLREILHLLSCNSPNDGIIRITNGRMEQVLVNWERVSQFAAMYRLGSATTTIAHPNTPKVDHFVNGALARRRFEDLFHLAAMRENPIGPHIEAAGWVNYDNIDNPYEVYSAVSLFARLKKASASIEQLMRRDLHKRSRRGVSPLKGKPRQIITARASYKTASGKEYDIRIMRRKQWSPVLLETVFMNHYEIPYDVDRSMERPENRRGKATKFAGTFFWNRIGVEMHTNALSYSYTADGKRNDVNLDANGAPLRQHPDAPHFLAWVELMEAKLHRLREFRRLIYDNTHEKRVDELLQGKRQRLSYFVEEERRIIESMCLAPRKQKTLSEAQWDELFRKLPGRTKVGIRRQIELMGFEYAKKHGYQKYRTSGLMLSRSAKRMKRWQKKGVVI